MKDSELFPIYYNGRNYYREHCDKVFLAHYTARTNLYCGHSLYLGENMGMGPDGRIYHLD